MVHFPQVRLLPNSQLTLMSHENWFIELERCKKFLLPVFDRYDTFTWEDVVDNVRTGHWLLYSRPNCALLLEVITYPRRKVLYILAGGGDLKEIIKTDEEIDSIAREFDCDSIEIRGRKGWERIANMHGPEYKTAYIVIRKDLNT